MTGIQDRAANAVLGIDVGGSCFITGVAGPNGDIVSRQRYMWKAYDAQAVMEELGKAIGYVLRNFRALAIPAVGLALPGQVDAAKGLWVNSANGAISGLPVAQMLSQQFGLPVFIENGARAAASAERAYGVCRDVDDFVYLDVSHTVSGAVFRDGVALAGNAGPDGDIGHLTVEEGGRVCPCGRQGCLSAYAGGTGLVRTYLEQGGAEQIDGKPPSGQLITQLADAGDEIAKKTFELEGHYLGMAAAMACRDGKPQKVVVGGGLTPAFAHLGGAMERTLREQGCGEDIAVEATGLSFDGRLLGAAAMALAGLQSPRPG